MGPEDQPAQGTLPLSRVNGVAYVWFMDGNRVVQLDGYYTIEDLDALAAYMRANLKATSSQ